MSLLPYCNATLLCTHLTFVLPRIVQGGAAVHGDVHPMQWLRTADGAVKLNDFNRAKILDWNMDKQFYCKAARCHGGVPRRPFRCDQQDVFRFGNNIYTLLTGSWLYQEKNPISRKRCMEEMKSLFREQKLNCSSVLGQLVEVMLDAWDVERQVTIFEIVSRLREAQKLYYNAALINI